MVGSEWFFPRASTLPPLGAGSGCLFCQPSLERWVLGGGGGEDVRWVAGDRQRRWVLGPLAHVLPGTSTAAGQLREGRGDILRLPHRLAIQGLEGWAEAGTEKGGGHRRGVLRGSQSFLGGSS